MGAQRLLWMEVIGIADILITAAIVEFVVVVDQVFSHSRM